MLSPARFSAIIKYEKKNHTSLVFVMQAVINGNHHSGEKGHIPLVCNIQPVSVSPGKPFLLDAPKCLASAPDGKIHIPEIAFQLKVPVPARYR